MTCNMFDKELNKLVCGDEKVKKYIYENIPRIGEKIEEIVELKNKYDMKMDLFSYEIMCLLKDKDDD